MLRNPTPVSVDKMMVEESRNVCIYSSVHYHSFLEEETVADDGGGQAAARSPRALI